MSDEPQTSDFLESKLVELLRDITQRGWMIQFPEWRPSREPFLVAVWKRNVNRQARWTANHQANWTYLGDLVPALEELLNKARQDDEMANTFEGVNPSADNLAFLTEKPVVARIDIKDDEHAMLYVQSCDITGGLMIHHDLTGHQDLQGAAVKVSFEAIKE